MSTVGFGFFRRIPDPTASKPDDWDEDAPRDIPDEEAVKPEGWLEDEAAEVDDAGAHHHTHGFSF